MWLSQQSQKLRYHESICDYLKSAGVNFTTIDLDTDPNDYVIFRGVIFQDEEGMLMAIVPEDGLLDVSFINQQLQRQLTLALANKLDQLYLPCESTTYPPLSEFFGLPAVIDEDILQVKEVGIHTGMNGKLLLIKRESFLKLQNETGYGKLTIPMADLLELDNKMSKTAHSVQHLTPLRMKQRLKQTFRLPAMPAVAGKILKLRFDPKVTIENLTQIIQKDPCLSAQLMSWVQSPYHGWRGKVTTIEDAITKILGYDLVVNLTLMTALGQSLKMPINGPLGVREYWRTALTTAYMVQELVDQMPQDKRPSKGLAYLSGLLHNFGHFLLGQLFPSYFVLLEQLITTNPHISIPLIERYAFGLGHDQLGIWLMEAWYLPPEIITAAKHYQDEAYSDEYATYVHLVAVASNLCARIENSTIEELSNNSLAALGLTEQQANMAYEKVLAKKDEIETLIGP